DFYIYEKLISTQTDGSDLLDYIFTDFGITDNENFAYISCRNRLIPETARRELNCNLHNFPSVGEQMPIAPGNIGPNYIYAENANGDVFEAFRVNYKSY
ncbi:MAG: hypothetical protein KDI92_08605, partial [Xanthomonadales bacterium]|nr:hypothetical protein [Xanthomonadales bacterium]